MCYCKINIQPNDLPSLFHLISKCFGTQGYLEEMKMQWWFEVGSE